MPRKRSRPETESKFRQAVLQIVAEEGCGALGINAVAQRAGTDKVLIYRYFGSFDGLLRSVAESRDWLPEPEALQAGAAHAADARGALLAVARTLERFIRQDPAGRNLLCWRYAVDNPLTRRLDGEWRDLWEELARRFAEGRSHDIRRGWGRACEIASLLLQAEVCGGAADWGCLDAEAAGLPAPGAEARIEPRGATPDSLPTNLL